MEAILKSGKKIHGRLAEILIKKGSATPFESDSEPEVIEAPKVEKKAKKKVKK